MKQTAIEWLYEQMLKPLSQWPDNIWEQAKEMEKQQITDAYHAGIEDVIPYNYFENTYKSKDNESND